MCGGCFVDWVKLEDEVFCELFVLWLWWCGNVFEFWGFFVIDVCVCFELWYLDILLSGELIVEVEWEV